MSKYLTVEQVAYFVNRTPQAVYRWIKLNLIKTIRGGFARKRWLIPKSEVNRIMDAEAYRLMNKIKELKNAEKTDS